MTDEDDKAHECFGTNMHKLVCTSSRGIGMTLHVKCCKVIKNQWFSNDVSHLQQAQFYSDNMCFDSHTLPVDRWVPSHLASRVFADLVRVVQLKMRAFLFGCYFCSVIVVRDFLLWGPACHQQNNQLISEHKTVCQAFAPVLSG